MKRFTPLLLTILLMFLIHVPSVAEVNQSTIFTFTSTWKYLDNGSDLGQGWHTLAFDDSNWKSGNGKFGYGIGDASTTVSYGPKSSPKYITTYFRKSFSIVNPSDYTSFSASVKRDDGVVIYLNGIEVHRDNMPAGTIGYQTLALAGASDDGTEVKSFSIPSSYFKAGPNVIAVEVHQSKASSSDLAFDLELAGNNSSLSQFKLDISVNGGGTVSRNPDLTIYEKGSDVTLTAMPDQGSVFSGWSGDATGTASTVTIPMDADKAVTANFINSSGLQQVTSFTLVNSATEKDIQAVVAGTTISLASLPTTKLNIRANTSPASVGSVKFELSGAQSLTYTDNGAPYALHGDDGNGNYYYGSWNPPAVGTYTLKATPYSGSKGTGTAGSPLTITFTIAADAAPQPDQTPPTVSGILRQTPTTSTTSATTVIYRALFSEKVSGVDPADFVATVISGTLSSNISAVAAASTDGTAYDVTVSAIQGTGTLRLDLKTSGTGIKDEAGNMMTTGYTSGETYIIQPEPSAGTEGFISITPLSPLPIHTSLGDQPQSKVWKYADKWWAVLPSTNEGTHIWRLDGTEWTRTIQISDSDFTRADCKVDGSNVHILLFRGANLPSKLVSVEYGSVAGDYTLWSQRSSSVLIPLDAGVKTATIDIDGTGRMWLASNGNRNALVRWSDAPYSTWSTPIVVASGLTDDDICAVVNLRALNKIGFLWSNQNTKRFGFKTHANGASPATWSADEVPASQSAIESGDGMADDHLNMAVASDGTLYCAVKTGYKTGLARIALLVRRPTGSWDNLYEVSKAGNRPIVILNEHVGKVKVIYAAPSAGGIYYKEALTSNIQFGSELSLIDETCDYATSSKNNYTGEIVIFASTGKQGYSVLASDDTSIVTSHEEEAKIKVDNLELTVYPNPIQDKARLSFSLPNRGPYAIYIYDAKGTLVEKMLEGASNREEHVNLELNWANRSKGLYLIKLVTSAGFSTHRVILSK
ncbi:InlB B-repeat-containing protein [Pontibacter flavimaris]|uniref:T9SS C-terminal target domain-containing protein n=1 Tax=Pontibacter flavimaris TaxID=1797110 RepID=A0A1Q5PBH9_9BACT|nr:T9SS type A sorting domain-containing protein [Pontibacter flavimaris]OKL39547.1 hypothetical protein A3841_00945 [Pontibacter flavimaris]